MVKMLRGFTVCLLISLGCHIMGIFTSPGVGAQAPTVGRILLVKNPDAPNPFGAYLAEVLRAEGINAFAEVELSAVDDGTLSTASLVILACRLRSRNHRRSCSPHT